MAEPDCLPAPGRTEHLALPALGETMKPYIKRDSPLRGENRPGIVHQKGLPAIEQRRQKEEVKATRRALKKAARREGKAEIAAAEA